MRRKMTVKRFAQGMIVPCFCVGLISYFSWHAVYGEYGAFALTRLDERVTMKTMELDKMEAERTRLERRAARLPVAFTGFIGCRDTVATILASADKVDPDMLDEQSRASLGYSRPEELTIYWDSVTRTNVSFGSSGH